MVPAVAPLGIVVERRPKLEPVPDVPPDDPDHPSGIVTKIVDRAPAQGAVEVDLVDRVRPNGGETRVR